RADVERGTGDVLPHALRPARKCAGPGPGSRSGHRHRTRGGLAMNLRRVVSALSAGSLVSIACSRGVPKGADQTAKQPAMADMSGMTMPADSNPRALPSDVRFTAA